MTLAAAAVIAGCGGSGGSKQDKAFVNQANTTCFNRLSPVREAVDTTKTNSPRDDVLAQAQQALTTSANEIDALNAPSDKRAAQTGVSAALRGSSQEIGNYLRDKTQNEPATSSDWNKLTAQLSQLQQTASGYGLKACAIPVE